MFSVVKTPTIFIVSQDQINWFWCDDDNDDSDDDDDEKCFV